MVSIRISSKALTKVHNSFLSANMPSSMKRGQLEVVSVEGLKNEKKMTRDFQAPESLEEQNSLIKKIEKLELELSKILDLDEMDASIYLNLLRMGPVNASILAREFHLDRTKVYRTIDKLLNLKIVSTTFSKPKLCIANKPEDVFKNALERKESQATRIRDESDHIIKSINETIPTNFTSSLPTFHISQGTSYIYSEIERLLENATNTVYIVTDIKDVSKMYHTKIPEKIKKCEKNGVKVCLITQVPNKNHFPFISRLGATETRVGNHNSKGRMIVEKGKQLIMSDAVSDVSDQNNIQTDYAICTNSNEIVNNIFMLCSLLWNNSESLNIKRSTVRNTENHHIDEQTLVLHQLAEEQQKVLILEEIVKSKKNSYLKREKS